MPPNWQPNQLSHPQKPQQPQPGTIDHTLVGIAEAVGLIHNNDFENRWVQASAISKCGVVFALRLSAAFWNI
jgi:hypothetical protein